MAEAKGGGAAKAELPVESFEQGRFGSWSAAGRRCGIPVQPWRWTTPWGRQRGDQWRQVGSRPGGGLSVVTRYMRILSTCAGSVQWPDQGSVQWPDQGSVLTAMIFMGL